MAFRRALGASLLVALLALARAQPKGFVNEHNGMIFHYDQTHHTIPPHASAATFSAAEACVCSDADPRDDTQLVTTTCFHQRVFGNCQAEFMMGALEELVETDGFCQMSCGRCQCCDSPANIIAKTGWGDRFLEYAATVPGFMDLLQHPGMLGTLLVPTNEAWEALEAKVSPAVLNNSALLEQILKLHWVPPEPRTRGLWTTPFLSTGSKVYTASDAPVWLETQKKTLPAGTTMYGGLTGIAIRGPVNKAIIQESDLRACKLLIDSVDEVLLPWAPTVFAQAAIAPEPLAVALETVGCVPAANTEFNGTAVYGVGASALAPLRVPSAARCCGACRATSGCTAWNYCPTVGGCLRPERSALKYGQCDLLNSPRVDNGHAAPVDRDVLKIPTLGAYVL